MSDADAKGLAAALNEGSGIGGIVFTRGYGETVMWMPIAIDTKSPAGWIVVTAAVPPRWATNDTLVGFGARATAAIIGICPLCDRVASTRADEHGQAAQTFVHDVNCLADDEMLRALLTADQIHDRVMRAPRNAPCPCGVAPAHKAKHCRRMQP